MANSNTGPTSTTIFRLLVIIAILVMILLSLVSFRFISPLKAVHSVPVNLNAPALKPTDPLYLAICVPIFNDPNALPEFLTHHYHHHNIRRFYVVDQSSEPSIASIFTPDKLPIPADSVIQTTVPPSTDNETGQFAAYDACQTHFGRQHAWIAYLDVDEYLERTQESETIQDYLSTLDKNSTIGALGINVLLHTSNNHTTKPTSSYRKAFTECVASDFDKSPNEHIKSFVKTKYYERPRTDHNFITKSNTITVGEDGDIIPFIFRRPVTTKKFAIHHYGLRSTEEFQERIDRGEVEEPKKHPNMWEWWNFIEGMKKMECGSLAKYNP